LPLSVSVDTISEKITNGVCEFQSVIAISVDDNIYEAVVLLSILSQTTLDKLFRPISTHSQLSTFIPNLPLLTLGVPVVIGPSLVNVGASPQTSLIRVPKGDVYVGVIQHSGFCWNNEYVNKRPKPSVCDQTPTAHPRTLTYFFGSLSNHILAIQRNRFVTACDEGLLVGTYDQGHLPSLALVAMNEEMIGVVAVHEGITDFHTNCGTSALPYEGVVVDGWVMSVPM
jgi:hypothetical protein